MGFCNVSLYEIFFLTSSIILSFSVLGYCYSALEKHECFYERCAYLCAGILSPTHPPPSSSLSCRHRVHRLCPAGAFAFLLAFHPPFLPLQAARSPSQQLFLLLPPTLAFPVPSLLRFPEPAPFSFVDI